MNFIMVVSCCLFKISRLFWHCSYLILSLTSVIICISNKGLLGHLLIYFYWFYIQGLINTNHTSSQASIHALPHSVWMKCLEGCAESLLLIRHKVYASETSGMCSFAQRERTANVSFWGGTCLIMSLPVAVCECAHVCIGARVLACTRNIKVCLFFFVDSLTMIICRNPNTLWYFVWWADGIKIIFQCSVTVLPLNT